LKNTSNNLFSIYVADSNQVFEISLLTLEKNISYIDEGNNFYNFDLNENFFLKIPHFLFVINFLFFFSVVPLKNQIDGKVKFTFIHTLGKKKSLVFDAILFPCEYFDFHII